jgi:hypothetical protein
MSRLGIRMKLLVVFMLLFTAVFAVACYWFYQYATNLMMDELRNSLVASASTAVSLIDPVEHAQVFASGAEDDAQYTHIASQLRLVRDANPKVAAIYTMVLSPNPNEMYFVVSADENPETRAHLREPYDTSNAPEMPLAFDRPIADVEMGADEFGVWLSGYAPIRDAQGKSIAIVGVDMTAEDVTRAQASVRNASILAFIVAYAGVLAATFLLSGSITKPLSAITREAKTLEQGAPFEPERLARVGRGSDEVAQLARVFSQMAVQVQTREQKLKQEVIQLRIEIDEAKRALQVAEIADTDYFQNLQAKAKDMRGKRKGE